MASLGGSVGNIMRYGLLFETLRTSLVVDAGVDGMFDTSLLFGFLAIVPTIEGTYEVAGDAAETFELISKVLVVGVEIFLGGLFVAIFGDKERTGLYEAANMEVFVFVERFERGFDIGVRNLGVIVQGFLETVIVELLGVVFVEIDDVLHAYDYRTLYIA